MQNIGICSVVCNTIVNLLEYDKSLFKHAVVVTGMVKHTKHDWQPSRLGAEPQPKMILTEVCAWKPIAHVDAAVISRNVIAWLDYMFWETQHFVEPFMVQDIDFFFGVSMHCMISHYLHISLVLKGETFDEVLWIVKPTADMTWFQRKAADQL